jgi:lambda family phage tail tape measure protein
MSASTRFEILATVKGLEGVNKLKNSVRQLTDVARPTSLEITKLRTAAKQLGSQSDVTENELRQQVSVLTELRANVSLTSAKYRLFTRDIQKAELALNKASAAGKRSGLSLRGAAKGLGAVAAGGVFGGPEGMIGGAIGLKMGGPLGAATGAAIGAQVGMARKAIGATAEYSAALARQRKALKLVIADTNTYTAAQGFLLAKSEALAIPQDVITRQFTALTASVIGAGHSVSDAEKVFESIASGIRGTGGSLEDMKAAMTATAQVFSKGKVSAEELRQQLGERLPGAFTIFAESMGKTPAELDKALEGGKVTLDDFMKFSETLFAKYGKNAEILAAGPEAAGDRLATAMSSLKDNVGVLLQPVGASFQDTFTGIVKNIDGAAKALRDFLKIGDKFIKEQIEAEEKLLAGLQKQRDLISSQYPGLEERLPERFASIIADADSKIADQINKINELRLKLADINGELTEGKKNTEDLGNTGKTAFENLKAGATSYMDSIKNISQQIQDATKNAFTKMEDALVNFVQTGKLNFADFARSIIADITKIYIRSQILKMFQGLGSLFGPTNTAVEGAVTTPNWGGGRTRITSGSMPVGVNALGNVYGKNGIVPFAYGGVVDKPTLFPFSKGTGLMGEAGPEAIMPLKRTQDGRLGVEAAMGRYSGSGSTTVNYTGPVMNFNGDDYVPRSAVNDIINAAASQGAKAGENRTLSTLKNSRSARSRLGM